MERDTFRNLRLFPPVMGLLLWLTLLLGGCAVHRTTSTNYYILEYYPHLEREELIQETPLPYTLQISPTTIPRTYNRKQLVIRHFGPKITYAERDLWSIKPSDAIPGLLEKRFNRYKLFRQVQRDFLDTPPDLELRTIVHNLEMMESQDNYYAHLNMDFVLARRSDESHVVKYSTDVERPVSGRDPEQFVTAINELLLQETDRFIVRILTFYDRTTNLPADSTFNWFDTEAEQTAKEPLPENLQGATVGMLFLPALSGTDGEPFYMVYKSGTGEHMGEARMGNAVGLPEGTYWVKFGSAPESRSLIRRNIKVYSHYKTTVKPDWGCLTVRMVDEHQNFQRVQYELFEAATGKSIGTDFPVEEEIGETPRVWVLEPGLYKITINDEPFYALQDFTTVQVLPGKSLQLTIVVDTDEDGNPTHLVGAGVLAEQQLRSTQRNFKYSSSIHTNFSINSDNKVDHRRQKATLSLTSRLDNRVVYDKRPFFYSLRNRFELENSKSPDADLRVVADELDLKNTFIVYFLKNTGFYSRFDVNTHLFPAYDYSGGNYLTVSVDDDTTLLATRERLQVQKSWFPLTMKEGFGLNLRLFKHPRANLNLRGGLGWRQLHATGNFLSTGEETTLDTLTYRVFREQLSERQKGIEFSLVGRFRLPYDISYTTDADFLLPFNQHEAVSLIWENDFTIRLYRYLSFEYEYKLRNQKVDSGSDYLVHEHSAYVRLTYIIR